MHEVKLYHITSISHLTRSVEAGDRWSFWELADRL
jgi:hypothetical protein